MSSKKIPSVSEQVREGGGSLDRWARGEARLRTTIATRDGSRHTEYLTRDVLQGKLENAQALKEIRAHLGLSQSGFSRLLRATVAAVKQWEAARRTIPAPVFALAELARDIPAVRERLQASMLGSSLKGGGGKPKIAGRTAKAVKAKRLVKDTSARANDTAHRATTK